jgi:hypothetical protein
VLSEWPLGNDLSEAATVRDLPEPPGSIHIETPLSAISENYT